MLLKVKKNYQIRKKIHVHIFSTEKKRVDRINLLYQNVLTSINFKKSVYKRMMSQNFDKEVE